MGQPIRPVVIAHRGASGYLPEHTIEAKQLAYEMGADYLEQDVVATGDDQLIVLHDIHLDRVSNVQALFPDRHREDGRFYARDFSLDEIKMLAVHERRNADGSMVYPGRHPGDDRVFRIHTFSEELSYVAELEAEAGRPVGIYPEIKRPSWHQSEGIDITSLFIGTLQEYGYEFHNDPAYVQCFDARELRRIRTSLGSELKLIQLIGENDWGESDTDYDELRSTAGLKRLTNTVDGIGPWVNQIFDIDRNGRFQSTGLVEKAHELGLAVHPYTFRADDLPPGIDTFAELINRTVDGLSIDGFFTDFPDLALDAIRA